ncbi:GDSL family lipase [Calothrix sp. PCC 7716]|nr:GDSL family lipase [Calothrix sp. PCC 7716]
MSIYFYSIVNKYQDMNLDVSRVFETIELPPLVNERGVECNKNYFQPSHIYAFGDSLSDIGNCFDATKKALAKPIPATPPYFSGRFSNGILWVEYIAQLLGLCSDQSTNYAIGGATTGATNSLVPNTPGLTGLQPQIDKFKAENNQTDIRALYTIWAGANDYLGAGVTDYNIPVKNLSNAVKSLASVGAKNIMVFNLPDLGNLPRTRNDIQESQFLTNITRLHNSALASELETLKQSFSQSINLILIDAYVIFNQIFSNPAQFGFTNVKDSALSQHESSLIYTESFFFWDEIHPTTASHLLMAHKALEALVSVKELSLV